MRGALVVPAHRRGRQHAPAGSGAVPAAPATPHATAGNRRSVLCRPTPVGPVLPALSPCCTNTCSHFPKVLARAWRCTAPGSGWDLRRTRAAVTRPVRGRAGAGRVRLHRSPRDGRESAQVLGLSMGWARTQPAVLRPPQPERHSVRAGCRLHTWKPSRKPTCAPQSWVPAQEFGDGIEIGCHQRDGNT